MATRSKRTTRRLGPYRHEPMPRIARVLVATDFSRGADLALRRALQLPLAERAELGLLHVLPPGLPPDLRTRSEAEARRTLAELERDVTAAAPERLRIETAVAVGHPYVEIIRHARSTGAELVVIGRHGRRTVRDLFIGSTAERVLRKGGLPVLVVHRRPSRPYHHPLIAISLEDTARTIIELGLRVLGPEVRSVPLVHAYQAPFEGFVAPGLSAAERESYRREFKQVASQHLDEFLVTLGSSGLACRPVLRLGDPRRIILDEVERRNADLAVLGTHGRHGLSHVLLGSVAEHVVREARCDVLVARPVLFSFALP